MALSAPTISPLLLDCAYKEKDAVFEMTKSAAAGLKQEEVEARLEQYGPNNVAQERRVSWPLRLVRTYYHDPLSILLTVLAIASYLSDDLRSAIVIGAMVVLSMLLRFIQESKADAAAAKLKEMIHITATVQRDGKRQEVPLAQLVPGDLVLLAAGDMIPADVRLISAKDLFISQASLTGESFPTEKFELRETRTGVQPLELTNICFMGTNVESGTATAVVVATGQQTYFGGMAKSIVGQQAQTSFDQGVRRFTWLMIGFMCFMAPTVFFINWLTKGVWFEAFMFALAVAVGLTPEMLPMIVTVCLSKGALSMSRMKVIVKRLNSIQNFGAMDVLCTDKTGTLTLDRVILEKHCDVVKNESVEVLRMAYLNSFFQTGLKNVLDRAILAHEDEVEVGTNHKIDEIPFDFGRKVMSVVVGNGGAWRLIAKGAPEEIMKRCTRFELNGKLHPVDPVLFADLREEYYDLSADGFRVLAIAYKDVEKKTAYSRADESELILSGYIAFFDPPKDSSAEALAALQKHGVQVKVLTGDNELVTRKICQEVGLNVERIVLGGDVEKMNDEQLADTAETATIFARLSPAHKRRIILALKSRKHVVGYMGDGINDAPALRAADVGISVDTAVDIAREAADLILLEKSLLVLEHGVIEGRKVFANILKYIKMGASSNFGNMFSVIGGSAFLPFLPMKPVQVLTNNLLYDFSQVSIPTDSVDDEFVAKPRPWSMKELTRFIVFIGPISSIFDYTTYFMMLYVFKCYLFDSAHPDSEISRHYESLFQTGWFVESLATQTLIVHIIRTNKIPFLQSRASWPLMVTTAVIIGTGIALSSSSLGAYIGFTPLPPLYWPLLAATLLCYCLICQGVKALLVRRQWV
ncbi:MAG TPA: magnesium-translocating P-type ATPase [Planctomycetota bacterium]|jgi:Mg2+-importing ATPase